jgi:hypothetical protein
MSSPFEKAWAEWVAEGASPEECARRATNMQEDAIKLYDSECRRLFDKDALQAEYYDRAYNSGVAGILQEWPALKTVSPERRRWLQINSDYLYGLFLRTGGW